MRVQAVVRTENAGYCNCDWCSKYTKCFRLTLALNTGDSVSRKACLYCLTVGSMIELGGNMELEYTKQQRRRSNKKAKKSEVKTANETGGRCTGYFPDAGDSRNSRFMFEDKTRTGSDQKSFRLTESIVLKGRSQAQKAGLTPVFRIHLQNVSIGVMLWDDLINLVKEEE